MHYYAGIKSLWPLQINQPVIDAIKKLNSRNKVLSIGTYDFSTLHTNIPHNKLKNVMRKLINFYFKGEEKQFVAVTNFGGTWTVNKNRFKVTFVRLC